MMKERAEDARVVAVVEKRADALQIDHRLFEYVPNFPLETGPVEGDVCNIWEEDTPRQELRGQADVDRSDLKREIIEAAQKAQYYSLQIRRLMESNRNGSTSYPPAASMFAGDDEHWGNGKFSDLSTINLGHDSAAIYLRAQSLIHQQTQGQTQNSEVSTIMADDSVVAEEEIDISDNLTLMSAIKHEHSTPSCDAPTSVVEGGREKRVDAEVTLDLVEESFESELECELTHMSVAELKSLFDNLRRRLHHELLMIFILQSDPKEVNIDAVCKVSHRISETALRYNMKTRDFQYFLKYVLFTNPTWRHTMRFIIEELKDCSANSLRDFGRDSLSCSSKQAALQAVEEKDLLAIDAWGVQIDSAHIHYVVLRDKYNAMLDSDPSTALFMMSHLLSSGAVEAIPPVLYKQALGVSVADDCAIRSFTMRLPERNRFVFLDMLDMISIVEAVLATAFPDGKALDVGGLVRVWAPTVFAHLGEPGESMDERPSPEELMKAFEAFKPPNGAAFVFLSRAVDLWKAGKIKRRP